MSTASSIHDTAKKAGEAISTLTKMMDGRCVQLEGTPAPEGKQVTYLKIADVKQQLADAKQHLNADGVNAFLKYVQDTIVTKGAEAAADADVAAACAGFDMLRELALVEGLLHMLEMSSVKLRFQEKLAAKDKEAPAGSRRQRSDGGIDITEEEYTMLMGPMMAEILDEKHVKENVLFYTITTFLNKEAATMLSKLLGGESKKLEDLRAKAMAMVTAVNNNVNMLEQHGNGEEDEECGDMMEDEEGSSDDEEEEDTAAAAKKN